MRVNAGVPKAANVLEYTKETLIKTSYRELREEIVFSPDHNIIFTAWCRKRQAEKQEAIERGCSSVLGGSKSRLLEVGCGRHLPQEQHERGSFKDSAGHVSFELGCRGELATLLSFLKKQSPSSCI